MEVVLDNSDLRIAVQADELRVRKTYFVDTDREAYMLNGLNI